MDEILKGFLTRLNWKSGSMSEQGLAPVLKQAYVQATLIADAVIAALSSLERAAVELAEFYESLHYAAQRNKTTVLATMAFSKTVANMGGTMKGAQSTIDQFSLNLRSNEGFYSLLVGMGIKTKDSNGHLRNSVEILQDVGRVLAKMKYQDQVQYADLLGIDERTMRAITDPDFGKGVERYKQIVQAGGFDVDESAKSWAQFNNTFRDLMAVLDLMYEKILTAFIKQFGHQFKELTDLILSNSDEISDFILSMIDLVIKAVIEAVKAINESGGIWKRLLASVDLLAKILAFTYEHLHYLLDLALLAKQEEKDFERGSEFIWNHPLQSAEIFGEMALEGAGLKDAPKPRRSPPAGSETLKATPIAPDGSSVPPAPPEPKHKAGTPPTGGLATAEKLTKHLMDKFGLTREQAIGMTGVMSYESGNFGTLQEQAKRNDAGGYGFAQWTGPRRDQYFDWCKEHNLDPSSYEANVGYLDHDLSTGRYSKTIEAVRKTSNVRDAAHAFEWVYEGMRPGGPGVPAFENHMQRAEYLDGALPKTLGAESGSKSDETKAAPGSPSLIEDFIKTHPGFDPDKVSMLDQHTPPPIQSDSDVDVTIDRNIKISISGETSANSAMRHIARQQRKANEEMIAQAKAATYG